MCCQLVYAWGPWAISIGDGLLMGLAEFQVAAERRRSTAPNALAAISKASFEIPGLHNVVYVMPAPWRWCPPVHHTPPIPRRPFTSSIGCRRPAPAFFWRPCWRHLAADSAREIRHEFSGHAAEDALAAVHDRLHAGHRLHHALQRHGRDARPGVHADRLALSASSPPCSAGWASR